MDGNYGSQGAGVHRSHWVPEQRVCMCSWAAQSDSELLRNNTKRRAYEITRSQELYRFARERGGQKDNRTFDTTRLHWHIRIRDREFRWSGEYVTDSVPGALEQREKKFSREDQRRRGLALNALLINRCNSICWRNIPNAVVLCSLRCTLFPARNPFAIISVIMSWPDGNMRYLILLWINFICILICACITWSTNMGEIAWSSACSQASPESLARFNSRKLLDRSIVI